MPRLTSPSLKQQRWLKAYALSGNATTAAIEAYDCKNSNSASVIGFENLTKLKKGTLIPSVNNEDLPDILTPEQVLKLLSRLSMVAKKDSDKTRNLELLAKYHGLLRDKTDIEITTHDNKTSDDITLEYRQLLTLTKGGEETTSDT